MLPETAAPDDLGHGQAAAAGLEHGVEALCGCPIERSLAMAQQDGTVDADGFADQQTSLGTAILDTGPAQTRGGIGDGGIEALPAHSSSASRAA